MRERLAALLPARRWRVCLWGWQPGMIQLGSTADRNRCALLDHNARMARFFRAYHQAAIEAGRAAERALIPWVESMNRLGRLARFLGGEDEVLR